MRFCFPKHGTDEFIQHENMLPDVRISFFIYLPYYCAILPTTMLYMILVFFLDSFSTSQVPIVTSLVL